MTRAAVFFSCRLLLVLVFAQICMAPASAIDLADAPMFLATQLPGNVALTLSVEYPTASVPASAARFAFYPDQEYPGYFDSNKCYIYIYNATKPEDSYFDPFGPTSGAEHYCDISTQTQTRRLWSGNLLNYATMHTLDVFRSVLTGGTRSVDTPTETRLVKTFAATKGAGLFADKFIGASIAQLTPFAFSVLNSSVSARGTALYIGFNNSVTLSREQWNSTASYPAGSKVSANEGLCYKAQWYVSPGTQPLAKPPANKSDSPWVQINCWSEAEILAPAPATGDPYDPSRTYSGNDKVTANGGQCYRAKWWIGTQSPPPNPIPSGSAWELSTGCTSSDLYLASQINAGLVDYNQQWGWGDRQDVNDKTVYRLFINVRVCVPTMLEANCVQYGNNYKPEGLIQKYSDRLRFSVFSYLNDSRSSPQRDGGVMRARMNFVGPRMPVVGAPSVVNPNAEWSETTGVIVQNPDTAAVTETVNAAQAAGASVTISRSGVLNYINFFGYNSRTYKSNDPVGELYYAATRYFRNKGNVSSYSDFTGSSAADVSTYIDGFPVIKNWSDPIVFECQKNFILGIADVNTHDEGSVPGSRFTNDGPSLATVNGDDLSTNGPNEATPDGRMKNVVDSTRAVFRMEGGDISTSGWDVNSCGGENGNYYLAGMAYDMHVRDIRPDLAGFQSINTYWMDVEEAATYCDRNPLWMAAKYGGFTLPFGFDAYSANLDTSTLSLASWAESVPVPSAAGVTGVTMKQFSHYYGSDYRPRNFFEGANPGLMKDGLNSAFSRVLSDLGVVDRVTTALSFSSPKQASTGGANYSTSYDPQNWTSSLKGQAIGYDSSGRPSLLEKWSADTILNARSWTTRQIVTYCNQRGVAFNVGMSCSASFAAVDGVSTQSADNYIQYLRGDRSQEIANGGVYRSRTSLLGDILDAKLVAVGAPEMPLGDLHNVGYAQFRSTYAFRTPVVYVGANDGMMHAFNGTLDLADSGKELFAYIPSLIFSDTDASTAGGLSSLGNPAFIHRNLVNASPNVFDIDFLRAGTPGSTSSSSAWRSVLIGGLGKGGKGYYAIDVTDPRSWTSEQEVANKVLWEFSNGSTNNATSTTHMGYSYGDALVLKTAKYGWVVVLTSGYNNDDGNGYFFFVNPQTGALLETVQVPMTQNAAPINLAKASAFIPDYEDGTAESIYAGDLQGNVWRLDLTRASGSYSQPTRIAILTDDNGAVQPVTTRPLIEIASGSGKRYVLIGTGRLLADSDVSNSQRQSFYAMIDGTGQSGAFYGGSTALPTGVTFPIRRSAMEANQNLMLGISSNPTKLMGWYFDLPKDSTTNIGERINIDPSASNGFVAWAGNLPNGRACSPSGTSNLYMVDVNFGRSILKDASGSTIPSLAMNATARELAYVRVGDNAQLLTGLSSGQVLKADVPGADALKRLNWRAVHTTD